MKKTIGRIAILLVLAGFGYVVGVLHALLIWDPLALTVKRDFDLGTNYVFHPWPPPILGIIPAGGKVSLVMQKGGAAYIQVGTVVSMKALKDVTEE